MQSENFVLDMLRIRLRPGVDDKIAKYLASMPPGARSEFVRQAILEKMHGDSLESHLAERLQQMELLLDQLNRALALKS